VLLRSTRIHYRHNKIAILKSTRGVIRCFQGSETEVVVLCVVPCSSGRPQCTGYISMTMHFKHDDGGNKTCQTLVSNHKTTLHINLQDQEFNRRQNSLIERMNFNTSFDFPSRFSTTLSVLCPFVLIRL